MEPDAPARTVGAREYWLTVKRVEGGDSSLALRVAEAEKK